MDIVENIRKLCLGGNYELISYADSLNLEGYRHVAHCGIYSLNSHLIEHEQYDTKAAIMMVFRSDGMLGFPGGCVDKGEGIMEGLKRELKEEINLDVSKCGVSDPQYLHTFAYSTGKKHCCHFFKLELSMEKFESMEKDVFNAKEYGYETFGLLRVPLFTMKNGYNGLPSFLCNHFIADSRQQLLILITTIGVMSFNEVTEAINIYKCMKLPNPQKLSK